MHLNRIWIPIFCLSLSQSSCGQEYHQKEKSMKINKAKYNDISKDVKTFAYNPRYSLKLKAYGCTYEIYINDMLVKFSFTSGTENGIIPFPQLILGNGKQELKVKVYPQAKGPGELEQSIAKDAILDLEIYHEQFGKFKETSVLKAGLPQQAQGLPYFEYTLPFEAKVPYQLKGWEEGVDLSKENHQSLEREVLNKLQQFKKAFEEKDISTIATMIYAREKEIAQSYFYVSGEEGSYDKGWEDLEAEANDIEEVKSIEHYTLRFFGEGKVVSLLRDDNKFRDFPALYFKTRDGKLTFYALYFYRPRPGAPLEVIR